MTEEGVDTLYYDGACPVCAREMQRLARVKSSRQLRLVNIQHMTGDTSGVPSIQTLQRRLHLRRRDGSWLVGVEANAYAWQHTPVAWLWRIAMRFPFRPVVWLAYEAWAAWRFRYRHVGGLCGCTK